MSGDTSRHFQPEDASGGPVRLRLLATTDLHMHLTDWDYSKDRPLASGGLVRLAPLIAQAREEAEADGAHVLLFDNGDGLQGTALADLGMQAVGDGQAHPLMQAFDALGYDAIGLGNHDFDYGPEALDQCLTAAPCPVICSNVQRLEPNLLTTVRQAAILQVGPLRLGVLSALPPQTVLWNADRLAGRVGFSEIAGAMQDGIAQLRQDGCDLIVVLAHSGMGDRAPKAMQENAVGPVASLGHVAAIFGGHTHLPFAGQFPGFDVPVAMAGHAGQYLAQIDLTLTPDPGGAWQVAQSEPRLRTPDDPVPDRAAQTMLSNLLAPWHQGARARMAEPAGHTDVRLHSYFSLAHADAQLHLLAEAQRAAFDRACPNPPDLPILSAVAPGKCGGRGGPEHYTDIPVGPVQRRHVEDLIVFPNLLRAVVLTGAQIRDWLEMSACVFHHIPPGGRDAPLLNPDWPAHGFDVMFGLSYAIDLSVPARFQTDGRLSDPDSHRVQDLRHAGRPVGDQERFVVLATDYRLNGGGNVPGLAGAEGLNLPDVPLRAAMGEALDAQGRTVYAPAPWRFAPMPGSSATLRTGPAAAAFLEEIAGFSPRPGPLDADGFLPVTLTL